MSVKVACSDYITVAYIQSDKMPKHLSHFILDNLKFTCALIFAFIRGEGASVVPVHVLIRASKFMRPDKTEMRVCC